MNGNVNSARHLRSWFVLLALPTAKTVGYYPVAPTGQRCLCKHFLSDGGIPACLPLFAQLAEQMGGVAQRAEGVALLLRRSETDLVSS